MSQYSAFGKPRNITGRTGTYASTLVPLQFLNALKVRPIPITVTGASGITFTVVGSVSNPVFLWVGNDYISLKESLAYTWTTGAGNTIIATTGAISASQTPGSTGVRYFYAGINSTGGALLYPSTVAPSYAEGPFEVGYLGHPGEARANHWMYVGFHIMTATTPAFAAATKTGFVYNISAPALATGTTTWSQFSASAYVPKHGVRVSGYMTWATPGATEYISSTIGNLSDGASMGAVVLEKTLESYVSAATTGRDLRLPFWGIYPTSGGNLWGRDQVTAPAGNIAITQIEDVI